ncbi:hypothetical protein [Actinacidiphila polyblastidii]|uniref:hypothetical protein n=1 Tax=Actinacidiphila polyblastidii TaxID=3110430 RepID=UPI0039BD8F04
MNHRTPAAPDRLPAFDTSVLTSRQLRERGIGAALIAERCRPGGAWQRLLPQVYLLHAGPPSSLERVQAALLYAGRDPGAHGPAGGGREAMVTGLAALALHRFEAVPPLPGVPVVDVLVSRQRRLRDTRGVAVRRARTLPRPQDVGGVPCAPVPRALADALGVIGDPDTVRVLLCEAVRGGHCDASAVVRELADAGLLELPHVAGAVADLRAADRTMAEERLYAMVRRHALPDPVWNVALRLPGGPPLGGVDAYWPEHAVAVSLDARSAMAGADEAAWTRYARQREHLEALGITLVHLTPAKLAASPEQQAAVVRTALTASTDRTPAAYVVVTPR